MPSLYCLCTTLPLIKITPQTPSTYLGSHAMELSSRGRFKRVGMRTADLDFIAVAAGRSKFRSGLGLLAFRV